MKKLVATILSIILAISIVPVSAISANAQENDGGNNSEVEYTKIYTAADLDAVRFNLSGNYILMNDIDLSGNKEFEYWLPIGGNSDYKKTESFSGIFDGNGFAINGINITGRTETRGVHYAGLFLSVSGTVCNLNLTNVYIGISDQYSDSSWYLGGVAGYNSGNILNCSVSGYIGTTYGDGPSGLASINKGSISSCANYAEIRDGWTDGCAGIAYSNDGKISNCYNAGSVSTDTDKYHYAAGIAYTNGGEIESCYNVGKVSGYETQAIYWSGSGKITNSYYLNGSASSDSSATVLYESGMKNQLAFKGFDFDNIWTMGGDPDYEYPELQCFALSGKLGIKGNVAYLSTVEPDLSKIKRTDDTFTYEWLIDDQSVSTENTYTFSKTDIGKKVKLKVTGTKEFNKGTLYSEEFTVTKAVQEGLAESTELKYSDDNTIEIETLSNQDYSIDKINWQKSGLFENLDPNKGYTIYSRISENDEYLAGKPVEILNVTTDRRPITGSVNIVGATAFGDTLTADVSAVGPDAEVTYRYEWKRGDEVVGTNKTYTFVKEDIDKTLTLYVIGTEDYIGSLSSAPVTATKASVQVPSAPVVETKTNTTVKLVAKAGLEYSKDKTNWQDSTLFEGLSPNTEYTFYQRVAETETEFASKSSNGTKATTLKNTIPAPAKPVVDKITNNTVTLEKVLGYEYSMDGITWQTSNVFASLSPNTEYSFCQRIAENETDYTSAQSGYVTVVTLKNTVAAPSAPQVQSATDYSVTLKTISGYEYSKNGTTWQKSNVFTGLEVLETYTFYQRVAETETAYASEKSVGTSFKVKYVASKPSAPVLIEVTNNKIVVQTQSGYQYSIDGTNWRSQGTFTGLNPNTTYAVCCRIPETDDYYASVDSSSLNVTTLKNTVNTPGAPLLLTNGATSVKLVAVTGYEYSKNGTTWQDSNIFSGLSPNTEYTFYQRVKETDTDYVSGVSVGLTITTLKNTVAKPSAPTLSQKTANSVTLTSKSGYEYSMDGAVWQASNVFAGLLPNTKYTFYQRVAETNIAYASTSSVALMVTTLKNTATKPEAPTLQSKTDTTVTLVATNGYEYSKNGTTWQSSNVFTGLSPDTSYNFYQRVAETNTSYASDISASLSVSTYKVCEVNASLHIYDNACDGTCNRCGGKRTPSAHEYNNACDKYCNVCNAERRVGNHIYSNACDANCNICNAARSIRHNYTKKTTVKATTNTHGYILTECSVCGVDYSKITIYSAKTFSLSATEYAYNKKVKKPTVTVYNSIGQKLKKDTDYTVSYSKGLKNIGKYKVTVKLKGNYSGTKTLTFAIKPTTKTNINLLVGATSKIGAKSNKKITYKSSKKSVKVSSSGVVTALKKGSSTITVKSNGISQKIKVVVKNPYVEIIGSKSVYLGGSIKLTTESNCKAKVKWSSSSKNIKVSSSGKVTGKKTGSATVYATITYKGKTYKDSYKVTVKKPTMKLNRSSATVYVGDSLQLTATATPNATVKFKSSKGSVASVSASGVVTPKAEGTATITASFTYGGKTYSATCNVTVKKSNYRILKNHIIKNGTLNSDGHKMIKYSYDSSNEWIFGIVYDSKKDCLTFAAYYDSGSSYSGVMFDYKENQAYINMDMDISITSSATAEVSYTLDVSEYSNDYYSYTYHITTKGLLGPDSYKKLIKSYNEIAFSGWDLIIGLETGLSLSDIGFDSF